MRFYDTHAHFEDEDDVAAIVARAAAQGVHGILAVGGSESLNRNALRTALRVALGWDRDQIGAGDAGLKELRALASENSARMAAIGEIGIDCYYSPQTLARQMELFEAQLDLADALGLPVVVHTRDADDATLSAIDNSGWSHGDRLRGVIHSYTGGSALAGKLLDRGFMISFSGIATFRSGDEVRRTACYVPDDRILVETDSPFLAPVPLRGRRCEPAYVVHTALRIAEERKTAPELFSELTFRNAVLLFGGGEDA